MSRKKQASKHKAGRTPSSLPDPIKAIKQQAQALASSPAITVTLGATEDADPLDEFEVETAVDVLTVLAANPALLSRKQYKDLKRVGWDFGKVLAEQGSGAGNTIHSQVSHLLSISHYRRALVLLFELYVNKTPTKLGSLQRWVRDCDATSRPGEVLTEEEWEERQDVLKCLDMVLRVCGSDKEITASSSIREADASGAAKGVVRRMQPWDVRATDRKADIQDVEALWQLVDDGYQASSAAGPDGASFRAVQKTPGALRRPPNVYDSTVVASANPTPIDCSTSPRPTFSVAHPSIPSCSMVLNAISPATCRSIISSANAIGWEADQAAGGSAVDKTSVLAHNVVWLADEDFVGQLYERIRPFVQESVPSEKDGRPLKGRGINRRFRVYRYGSRQVYRPHIDGAWPAAGLDPVSGEYLHDASPADDPLSSRFTILIYLNSDINASTPELPVPGATTFFMPSPDSIGRLLAFPIAPVQGAVLVFPHGDAHGALLHEGSPVGDGGWKVVIRTDLLYESDTLTR